MVTLLLLPAGCVDLSEMGDQPVRPGCIAEKTMDGYTYDFARDVCEGQFYMYGNNRPEYEKSLDELDRSLDDLRSSVDDWQQDWDSYSWND